LLSENLRRELLEILEAQAYVGNRILPVGLILHSKIALELRVAQILEYRSKLEATFTPNDIRLLGLNRRDVLEMETDETIAHSAKALQLIESLTSPMANVGAAAYSLVAPLDELH